MGVDAPRRFSLKGSYVIMRGVSAEKPVVRNCVAEAIKHCQTTLADLCSTGFEYLEACGKCLCVPAHSLGLNGLGEQ